MTTRAASGLWVIFAWHQKRKSIPWKNEALLKKWLRAFVRCGGRIEDVRGVGIQTQRELERFAGLPLTPLPAEIPRCSRCGQTMKAAAQSFARRFGK